jgi:hypothetical protein
MAIKFDPSDLSTGSVDIVVDTANKTIEIKPYNASTNPTGVILNEGATGGVTGQCVYSWLKERWKVDTTFIKYPFPMEAITPEQFEFINGWLPKDDVTRKLIRTAGWAEKNAGGTVLRKYMGVVSLGSLGATDQPYFRFNTDTATNFTYPGPINEAVQIFGDATNGNFNYTDGDNFDVYCRELGKTFAYSNNSQIGASVLNYIVYRFPLSNGTDLKISSAAITADASLGTTSPWSNITVQYYGTDQLFDVDGDTNTEPYRYIITDSAGTATTQQIYEKIQWSLRQNSDIDTGAGTVNGKVATSLLSFVGDTLVGANGVYISGLNANYLNSVDFYDFNGVVRRYPFVSAGTINFGPFATSGDFKYWMFFSTTPNGSNYGTANALIVDNKDGADIAGTYSGSSVPWTFNYDSNTQGGRTVSPAGNVNVKVIGIGLSGGQFVSVDHVITRTAGQSILLSPAQERNYSNP